MVVVIVAMTLLYEWHDMLSRLYPKNHLTEFIFDWMIANLPAVLLDVPLLWHGVATFLALVVCGTFWLIDRNGAQPYFTMRKGMVIVLGIFLINLSGSYCSVRVVFGMMLFWCIIWSCWDELQWKKQKPMVSR